MESNRRGFLTSLFKGITLATVAPQIVTHGLNLKKVENLWIVKIPRPNPLWENAPYAVNFLFSFERFRSLQIEKTKIEIEYTIKKVNELFVAQYKSFPHHV